MTRAIAMFAVLVLAGLFALLNLSAFTAVTPLSLGFMTVDAPLGLIMLGVVVFTALLFTVWAMSMQAGALRDARRQTRELQVQRDLADKAEASRFTELRNFLSAEMASAASLSEQSRLALQSRLERLQAETRITVEQSTNALAASIGELEDRLERDRLLSAEPLRQGLATAPLIRR